MSADRKYSIFPPYFLQTEQNDSHRLKIDKNQSEKQ